jgi:hypothetical protein
MNTTLSNADVCALISTLTGEPVKRASSKDAAVARLLKVAEKANVDAASALAAGTLEAARAALRAAQEAGKPADAAEAEAVAEDAPPAGPAPLTGPALADVAERIGAETGDVLDLPPFLKRAINGVEPLPTELATVKAKPAASKAAAKADKAPSKAAQLVALAKRPEGVTNAEIKVLTGWTKLGGFHGAIKKAGLTLRRLRENGDTRWFAE